MKLKPETLESIERAIPRYPVKRSAVLPLLHAIQKDQGCIRDEAIEWVARKLELAPINVFELVTFYPFFRRQPLGRYHIRICRTLSCALCGGIKLASLLEKEFGCRLGETSADGLVTLEQAECLASCGTSPVMMIGSRLYDKLDEAAVRELAARIKRGELPSN